MYGVSQGQWPRMTFARSLCYVKGHMWSCADLNDAQCPPSNQWQQVPWLKTRLPWKVGRTLYLWHHSTMRWPDPVKFFAKSCGKGCPISYAKFQRDPPSGSAAISEKLMGGGINPCSARVRVKAHQYWLRKRDMPFNYLLKQDAPHGRAQLRLRFLGRQLNCRIAGRRWLSYLLRSHFLVS